MHGLDAAPAGSAGHKKAERKRRGNLLIWVTVFGLVALAWVLTKVAPIPLGSDTEYNLGLVGGIMMLILFVYPLRKHVRALHGWGATKHWFLVHMVIGIGGPFMILVHSQFHIGSVQCRRGADLHADRAGSGVVGRFLYVEIHHGLPARRSTCASWRRRPVSAPAKSNPSSIRPRVEKRLTDFQAYALPGATEYLARRFAFMTLGLRRGRCSINAPRNCAGCSGQGAGAPLGAREVSPPGTLIAPPGAQLSRKRAEGLSILRSSCACSPCGTFLHVPLVYMLVLSAIAHVVAVHMY